MNFLAHLLLGGEDADAQVGSILGDFLKGGIPPELPPAMAESVRLHRRVDSFCDSHPSFQRSRRRIPVPRRRFAGIVIDLSYDHLLARHWHHWCGHSLDDYARRAYARLLVHRRHQPDAMRRVVSAMAAGDWLGSYRNLAAVATALDRIALRFRRPTPLPGAVTDVERAYAGLEQDFLEFFPAVLEHSRRLRAAARQPPPNPL